jgi:GTP cyclohydrolase I
MARAKPLAVTQNEAEDAVRTCCAGPGKIPRARSSRHPQARGHAYRDWFSGYAIDPTEYLRRTFGEVAATTR